MKKYNFCTILEMLMSCIIIIGCLLNTYNLFTTGVVLKGDISFYILATMFLFSKRLISLFQIK